MHDKKFNKEVLTDAVIEAIRALTQHLPDVCSVVQTQHYGIVYSKCLLFIIINIVLFQLYRLQQMPVIYYDFILFCYNCIVYNKRSLCCNYDYYYFHNYNDNYYYLFCPSKFHDYRYHSNVFNAYYI